LLKIDKNTICLYGMDINTTLRSKGEWWRKTEWDKESE
jgi:hypothetical protein